MIVVAGLFALAYSVAVLATVAMTGDLGFRCVFGHRVIDVEEPQRWLSEPAAAGVAAGLRVARHPGDQFLAGPPQPGDALLAIGPWSVRNYHDFVKAQRQLRGRSGEVVEVRWEDAAGRAHVGQVQVKPPPMRSYIWSLVWFLQELFVFAVAARVYWRRPTDDSARLFYWLTIATVGAFMGGYHWTQIVVHPPLIYLFACFAVFVPVLSLHFYLMFPRVNPLFAAHWRSGLAVLYGLPVVALLGLWTCMLWAANDPDPARVKRAIEVLQAVSLGYIRLAALLLMLCLGILASSYRRARNRVERNQVRWILLATLLSFFPIAYLFWDTWNAPHRLGLSSSAWPMFVVSLLYTAAYAVSITRYKLMRAEEYLNRGVLYVLVSLSAGLLYSGGLVLAALFIGDRLRADRTSIGAIVAGLTAIVALLLTESARHGFQRVLDRRFFREKYRFDQAMRRMSQAVDSLVDRPTLARRLLDAAAEVLHVEWGALYVSDDDPARPLTMAACHGPEPDEHVLAADNPLVARLRNRSHPLRAAHALGPAADPATDAMIALGGDIAAPLEADGALAGVLVLGPKRNGMPYEAEEEAFLRALGSVATLALRSARIQATLEGLNQELRGKVDKIAEQRRRIVVLQDQLARHGSGGAEDAEPAERPQPLLAQGEPDAFDEIKGGSQAMRRMVSVARKVAASPSAVLIRGESGTGKELLAEAIHRASPRRDKPFVKVHCAALAQGLLESELFGHVKGAFTGADRDRVGRFQQANGGTLFLDEIGDINWEVQTKLLRVLQEMAFERVGSSQTVSVDVRLQAATHQDLEALIRTGKFREDLYYRLNVISLRTPPLRDRREDVFELALHFLSVHSRRAGKAVTRLDDAAVEVLAAYDWPGNVRELENAIERAVVLSEGPTITVDELPGEMRSLVRRRRSRSAVSAGVPVLAAGYVEPAGPDPEAEAAVSGRGDDLDAMDPEFLAYERQRLLDALSDAGGNKSHAARLLAIPRSTFFSKLKRHGLA